MKEVFKHIGVAMLLLPQMRHRVESRTSSKPLCLQMMSANLTSGVPDRGLHVAMSRGRLQPQELP